MSRNRVIALLAAVSLTAAVLYSAAQNAADQHSAADQPIGVGPAGKYVGKDGAISLPEDYRLKWIHLGTWYVEDNKGGPGQDHDVYAEPEAVLAFRDTGKWPQGATMVKEIRAAQKGVMTTGNVHWDAQIKQWFVMVKDTKNSFPNNPNWGRGWGWALYSIDDPKKNISTDYKIDCLICHVPAQHTDWIYTHGYPILHETGGPFKKYPQETYSGSKPVDNPKK